MVVKTARTVVALMMALSVFALAPRASAGTEVRREGSCSASSTWKLKLKPKPDNGQLEVEFEVDSNVAGQNWRVRLFQNGDRIFRGHRTTHGASGSFTLSVRADDTAGTDAFRGRASNPDTGETCVGRASI
jgi:hypothetical protein